MSSGSELTKWNGKDVRRLDERLSICRSVKVERLKGRVLIKLCDRLSDVSPGYLEMVRGIV